MMLTVAGYQVKGKGIRRMPAGQHDAQQYGTMEGEKAHLSLFAVLIVLMKAVELTCEAEECKQLPRMPCVLHYPHVEFSRLHLSWTYLDALPFIDELFSNIGQRA